ncbi:MAG: guanylate kinase [Lachnospiraceae bacterium]|nr:guanylate kinase [Lachnospiraceae bacterium]
MKTKKGLIIVISGFSGAGKGTIVKHLLNNYKDDYNLSISATTRAPRQGEKDGREYFFKTKEEFEDMITNGELLEYANFNGNYYGTPKEYVRQMAEEGKNVILEIEVQGALQIKKIFPDALLLFVSPPSGKALKERLVGRGTENADAVADRLAISSRESFLMPQYDYIIINDVVEKAVKRVHHIIKAENYRVSRNQETLSRIQQELKVFSKGESTK